MDMRDLDLTPEEWQRIIDQNTAPPDELDRYLRGVAEMDGKAINEAADEMLRQGASHSFLSLCIRLIWGSLILFVCGGAIFFGLTVLGQI